MISTNRKVQYEVEARVQGTEKLRKVREEIQALNNVRAEVKGNVAALDQVAAASSETALAERRKRARQEDVQGDKQALADKKAAQNSYQQWWLEQLREREQAEKQAQQSGMARLRAANQTATLNARLAAQTERDAQVVVRAALKERADLLDGVRLAHARARAEYDKASGQAADQGAKTAAAVRYRAAVRDIEAAMTALGTRTDWTNRELTQMAQLQQRIARERTTLGGGVNTLGLSGQISNALNSNLPRFVTAMQNSAASLSPILNTLSPSLGAAAINSGALAGSFTTLLGAATPLTLALPLVAVAAVTVGRGIMSSVEASAELEKAMNGLKASSGASKAELASLQGEARNVGREFGFLTRDVVAVQEELSKGGVSTADIAGGAAKAVAVLAKATGVDFKEAVSIAVPVMNVWNISGAQMMQVADAVSNGANKSALDVHGLAMSLQQVANSAESSGLSLNETIAVLAALADRGMQGSDAGTSLKVMLQKLQAPTKEATAALDQHSIAVFDSTGKQREMITVLADVMDAMDGMTDKQRSAFMMTVFGSDASRAITSSWRTGKGTLREYVATMGDQGTALQNAKTRTEGLRGAQDKMNSAWDAFKTSVGNLFTPAITTVIDKTTIAIDKLTQLADAANKAFNGTPLTNAGNEVLRIQREISGLNDQIKAIEAATKDPTLDAAGKASAEKTLVEARAALTVQQQALTKAQAAFADAQKQVVLTGKSGLPANVAGPRFGGDGGSPTSYNDAGNLTQYAGDVLRQTAQKTGVNTADMVVDYCAQWTRLTLGNADKRAQAYINKLFSGDVDKDGLTTAKDYALKAKSAGLLRTYTGAKDLQPGDVVFYTDNGQNHTGIYIGGGKVRGNNRVSYKASGGTNPVGDVEIDRLGRANGYVRASDLGRAAGLTERDLRLTTAPDAPAPKVNVPASDAALIAEAKRILTRIDTLTEKGDLTGKVRAEGVLKAFENGGPRAAAALEVARKQLAALDKETGKFGQGFDRLKGQLGVAESLFKLNNDAAAYAATLQQISEGAKAAATAEKAKNGETAKYRALLDLSGDAAGKLRSQQDALDRDNDTRAANRLKTQQALTAALNQGREADARRELQSLKDQQDEALDLAKNDAAKRAQIIAQTGPAIIAAEDRLANLRRDQRVKQAQADAAEAKKLPGADLGAIEKTRLATVAQAYKDAATDRAAARTAQAKAERTASDEAEKAAEQARANRLAAERALADGRLTIAKTSAQQVITAYDDEVKAAGDSADARLAVEQRLGDEVLRARNVLATTEAQEAKLQLERERNKAVAETGLTLKDRQALWAQYGVRISQVDQDLQATLTRNGTQAATQLDQAWGKVFDADDAARAKAYTEKVQGYLDRLTDMSPDELLQVYTEAQANRDTALMGKVFDLWEARREAEEAGLRALQQAASDGVAEDAVKLAAQLGELGDSDGAMNALQVALGQVMDAAQRGEDAAGAVDRLTQAINDLYATTTETDAFNEFVAGLGGTIDEQIMQVMDRYAGETDVKVKARLQALLATLRQQLPDFSNPYAAGLIPGANGFQAQPSSGGAVLDALTLTDRLGGLGANQIGEGLFAPDVDALMAGVQQAKDFLASGVADSLPEGVRQGLQDAVDNAQTYADTLASITGEAVADGASQALKAMPAEPVNLFGEKRDQIFSMDAAGELENPTKLAALRAGLDALRETGALTDQDLINLNTTIDDLLNKPETVTGSLFDLSGWQEDVQRLQEGIDTGSLSAEQARPIIATYIEGLLDAATAADAAGNPRLAQQFRQLAFSVKELSPAAQAAAAELDRLQAAASVRAAGQQVQDALGKRPEEVAAAYAQEAAALAKLGAEYPELNAQIEKQLRLMDRLKKLAVPMYYASIAQEVAQVAGEIAGLAGEDDLAQSASDLASGIGSGMQAATGITKVMAGDMTGLKDAILGTLNMINSVGEAIRRLDPAYQKWKKNQLEIASLEREGMGQKSYNNWLTNPYYDALQQDATNREKRANAGFFQSAIWSIFGGAPEVMDDEAAKVKAKAGKVFADLASDLASTAEQALLEGWESGDFSNVADKMGQQLDRFVARLAIQTVMAKSNLAKLVQDLSDEVARGGDTTDEVAAIKAEMGRVSANAQTVLSALPGFGSADSMGGGTSNSAGDAPSAATFFVAGGGEQVAQLGLHVDRFGGYVGQFGGYVGDFGTYMGQLREVPAALLSALDRANRPGGPSNNDLAGDLARLLRT